jgi:hypothetical protein
LAGQLVVMAGEDGPFLALAPVARDAQHALGD